MRISRRRDKASLIAQRSPAAGTKWKVLRYYVPSHKCLIISNLSALRTKIADVPYRLEALFIEDINDRDIYCHRGPFQA